ncbi:YafY family transcriptional regulator [Alphaproteobacteria bacterium KMM 3653]|uniref:YafY family transcriptional regulator n=1 Tax=Harenicola maris TaxID=2841044 RepID=A0AAP2G2S9_9RHOB|nr:YafY family transcriptional regulator [Harenicola maris]
MRRTDRLFELIQILRNGGLHRAQDIADRLDVSLRTIYRDMDALMASGMPIEGARGVGYRLTAAITLPPLNLTMEELEALHMGMAVVGEAGDPALKAAAASLSAKIDAVLPMDTNAAPKGWGFAIYPFADAAAGFTHMPALRSALRSRQKVRLTYTNLTGEVTSRITRPLHIDYLGRVWTLAAWCELREDFRVFRIDRITKVQTLPALFVDEPGKSLADYRARA